MMKTDVKEEIGWKSEEVMKLKEEYEILKNNFYDRNE